MIRQSLILFLCTLSLFADIDAQIEAIQNAPADERFKLMNAFKKEIIRMQETSRIEAMGKLKSITQSPHSNRILEELKNANTRHDIEHLHNDKAEAQDTYDAGDYLEKEDVYPELEHENNENAQREDDEH